MTDKGRERIVRGPDPDAELVKRAQKELPYVDRAFEELMLRHERMMFLFCQRLLDRPEDAAEVIQEATIKIFHNIIEFEGKSKFKTWLLQIVRRECFNHYRKNKHYFSQKNVDDLNISETKHNDLVSYDSEKTDARIHSSQILNELSYDDRQILSLRYLAELDLIEISEIMDLKLSAVKMRLYRAMDRAKQIAIK